MEDTIDVTIGRCAAMCTDDDGNIHMIYENGGMKYRKIIMK
jgi:hypothetical protein